jgi:hypothetical protein
MVSLGSWPGLGKTGLMPPVTVLVPGGWLPHFSKLPTPGTRAVRRGCRWEIAGDHKWGVGPWQQVQCQTPWQLYSVNSNFFRHAMFQAAGGVTRLKHTVRGITQCSEVTTSLVGEMTSWGQELRPALLLPCPPWAPATVWRSDLLKLKESPITGELWHISSEQINILTPLGGERQSNIIILLIRQLWEF